jgi:hypothetical protein
MKGTIDELRAQMNNAQRLVRETQAPAYIAQAMDGSYWTSDKKPLDDPHLIIRPDAPQAIECEIAPAHPRIGDE